MTIGDERIVCDALGHSALVVWLVLAASGVIQWAIDRWTNAEKK
jgi:hypothetical protein